MSSCFSIILSCLLLICITLQISADLIPKRTHLVDYNTTTKSYLFRGNLPLNQSQFVNVDYFLSQVLEPAFERDKRSPDEHFHYGSQEVYLVDISFLASILPKDHGDLKAEEAFFEQNPSNGELVHWTIIGNLINASSIKDSWREETIKHTPWDFDSLRDRIPQIHSWVHKGFSSDHKSKYAPNKPIIVLYIHCEAGVDRTGEVSGSYMMQYLQQPFLNVLKFDYTVSDRPIAIYSEYALTWYCWYLHYERGFPNDCYSWLPRN